MRATFLFWALLVACTGDIGASSIREETPNQTGQGGGAAGAGGAGLAGGATTPAGNAALVAGGALRRLSAREIEATINTLFPELSGSRPHLPPDGYAVFDNEHGQLDSGLAFLENISLVTGTIVEQARANQKVWSRVRTCGAADSATVCVSRFYDTWSPRVLRRPGIPDERKAFVALADIAADLGGIDDVLAVALEALLRQPEFSHRVELGEGSQTSRNLLPHELLSRLAFFLWGEAPDEALIKQADNKTLQDAKVRTAFAETMLADPRAERQVLDYHAQWLGYATMPRQGIGLDMWNESAALVRRVVFDADVPYENILTSDETFLTPALAQHYKLPAISAAGWTPYGPSGRLGILGHGTFLSAFANVGDTSPVKRGKNVLGRLLCTPIELPTDMKVDVDAKPADTQCRQNFFRDVHAANGSCRGCHKALDGIGFGLETFDRVGVPRTFEQGKPNCKLDGQGELDGVPFVGAAGLGRALAKHPDTTNCVAEQVVRFFLGVNPHEHKPAQDWAATLAKGFKQSGNRFKSLLMSVVADQQFSMVAPQ